MLKCLWKHSCKSSIFHIAILNGSFIFQRDQRRVAWSFVNRTTYRWSDLTLSIITKGRNCLTLIKPAIEGCSLWYRILFYEANFCPRLLILSWFSNHLYVVRLTNDPNATHLRWCFLGRRYACQKLTTIIIIIIIMIITITYRVLQNNKKDVLLHFSLCVLVSCEIFIAYIVVRLIRPHTIFVKWWLWNIKCFVLKMAC